MKISTALLLLLFTAGSLFAEPNPPAEPVVLPVFSWDILWSGSWEKEGKLENRGNLQLHLPRLGLTLREEILDRRSGKFPQPWPWEEAAIAEADSALLGGFYHNPTGSRLLYGILDEWGLSARLRNPWARSVPFAENHKPSMAELKTAPSSTKEAETYLYMGSPVLDFFQGKPWETSMRLFASTLVDKNRNTSVSWGLEGRFNKKMGLNLEGFYTGRELAPRKSSAWFSKTPPLPARDFTLYGFGSLFTSPFVSVSSDWAFSETFAVGRGVYGNLGLRIGNPLAPLGRRWQLSLAADGASPRYTDRNGAAPGEGFRTAIKFELKGKKSSLLKLSTSLRGSTFGEFFDRSTTTGYYRFPAAAVPFHLSRFSLTTGRNAQNPARTLDSLDGTLSLTLNPQRIMKQRRGGPWAAPVNLALSGSLDGTLNLAGEKQPFPYPIPQGEYKFDSAKVAWELSWSPAIFQFKTKTAYVMKGEKEGLWDLSFSAAIHGKPGRFSLKIASPDFPEKWDFTVSWRLNTGK
ncbi:hypothetical protein FACS189442_3430 [Spirochaetia bacterium]|nr:hypothetical protein FACS189442_3430 [Spirochaetia bacterium]